MLPAALFWFVVVWREIMGREYLLVIFLIPISYSLTGYFTVTLQLAAFPLPSLAVQVMTVVPGPTDVILPL